MDRLLTNRTRATLYCAFVAVACGLASLAMRATGDTPNEKHSDRAQAIAEERRRLIESEIEDLGEHEWAGEYYEGDGLGVNVSLTVAPANGYVFAWHGCLGLYDRNYGGVAIEDGKLRLEFAYPNERKGFQGLPNELTPVSWGKRKYLIPADDVVGFCNQINQGAEPRSEAHGRYLLRVGDEHTPVTGHPLLPAKHKPYLLANPITTEIVQVGDTSIRPSLGDFNFKDVTVTLNAGEKDGLLPGMELHVIDSEFSFNTVTVQSTKGTQSVGLMTLLGEDETEPDIGWKLSTHPDWRIQEPVSD